MLNHIQITKTGEKRNRDASGIIFNETMSVRISYVKIAFSHMYLELQFHES